MRILFLAPQPFFEVRGTPLAVRAFVRALLGLGHEVELLSYPQGEDPSIPGLVHRRSLRLPVGRIRAGASFGKLLLDVPFLVEAVLLMLRKRYDVVHAVEEAALLIAPFTRLLGVPLVTDVDSSIPDQLRYSGFARRGPLPWLADRLERHALGTSVAAITVCSSLTEGVRRKAPALPVFQIEDPPLVDPEAPPPVGAAQAFRDEWHLGAEPLVLYSGNLESYQGVELLVDAFAFVPGAQLVLMGGEPAHIERLRGRAQALGISERCLFTGKRPPEDLPRFLAAADVLVSPRTKGDNTPFKLYTYLASGRPIIATRIATHTQLLDDSTAFLVDPTPEGIASGIREALRDLDGASVRARAGRERLKRDFGPARHSARVKEAYDHITATVRASTSR